MELTNAEIEKLVESLGNAREAMPDCGQFARTRATQPGVERDAILQVHKWLEHHKRFAEIASFTQPDPPDLVATLKDGTVVYYEFAIIAHGPAIEVIKKRKQQGETGLYQNWTPETFQKRICDLVSAKIKKYQKHLKNETVAKPLILVLGSDSVLSHKGLVANFSAGRGIFDMVLLHLGYIPNSNGSPDSNYLILDIGQE
jgi:hypothetical protein